MGADLFESYAVTAISTMLLGALTLEGTSLVIYPLLLGAAGILASIIGVMFVKDVKEDTIMKAMYKGLMIGYLIAAVLFYFITQYTFSTLDAAKLSFDANGLFISALCGLAVALAIVFITEYYTAKKYRPVQEIAKSSQTGAATNIISGLSVGLESTLAPTLVICAGVLVSYYSAPLRRSGCNNGTPLSNRAYRRNGCIRPHNRQRRRHSRDGKPRPRGEKGNRRT